MFVICHNTVSCPKPIGVSRDGDVGRIIEDYLGRHIDEIVNYGEERDPETGKTIQLLRICGATRDDDDYFTIVTV